MSDPKNIKEEILLFLNQDAKDLLSLIKVLELNATQRSAMAAEIDKRFNLDQDNDPGGTRLKQKMEEDPDYLLLNSSAEILRESILIYLDRWSREYSLNKVSNSPPPPSNKALN